MRRTLVIATFALFFGTLIGTLSTRHATAQQPPPPPFKRYEYLCQPQIDRPWKPDGQLKLNALGQQGWELVGQLTSNADVFCFKRPVLY